METFKEKYTEIIFKEFLSRYLGSLSEEEIFEIYQKSEQVASKIDMERYV